jgi:hypothetical protein
MDGRDESGGNGKGDSWRMEGTRKLYGWREMESTSEGDLDGGGGKLVIARKREQVPRPPSMGAEIPQLNTSLLEPRAQTRRGVRTVPPPKPRRDRPPNPASKLPPTPLSPQLSATRSFPFPSGCCRHWPRPGTALATP